MQRIDNKIKFCVLNYSWNRSLKRSMIYKHLITNHYSLLDGLLKFIILLMFGLNLFDQKRDNPFYCA